MSETNPFWFGYYPGQPIQRRPSGSRPAPPRPGINWTGFDDWSDQLRKDIDVQGLEDRFVGGTVGLPKYMWEKYKKDFWDSWSASIKSSGLDAADLERLTQEQREDYPGFVGMKIDFTDIVTDPKKAASDFLNKSISNLVDFTDFSNQEQMKLWEHVLTSPANRAPPKPGLESLGIATAASALEARTTAPANGSLRGPNPLSLDDSGVYIEEAGTISVNGTAVQHFDRSDPYLAVRQKIVGLQGNLNAVTKRENSYDDVLSAAYKAFSADMQQKIDAAGSVDAFVSTLDLGAIGMSQADATTAIRDFQAKQKYAASLAAYKKGLAGKGTLKSTLDNAVTNAANRSTMLKAAQSVADPSRGLAAVIQSQEDAYTSFMSALSVGERAKYEKILKPYQEEIAAFKRDVLGSNAYKKFMEAAADPSKPLNMADAIGLRKALSVHTGLTPRSTGPTGGDFLTHSPQRKMLRAMERELRVSHPKLINHATEKGAAMQVILHRLDRERDWAFADELLTNFGGGKILDQYYWNRVKTHLDYLTPSYWVNRGLAKVHYFGLTIEPGDMGSEFRGVHTLLGFEAAKKGKGLFANRFKLKVPIGSKTKALALWGGKHFKFAESAAGLDLSDGALRYIVSHGLLHKGKSFKDAGFLNIVYSLNESEGIYKKLFASEAALEHFGQQFDDLMDWLHVNASRLGIDPALLNDPDFLLNFLSSMKTQILSGDSAKVTVYAVGLLQKYTYFLNNIQTQLAKRFAILRVLARLQTILSEKTLDKVIDGVSRAVSEFVDKFLKGAGVGTGGLLTAVMAIIGPIVKKLVQFVVKKALKAVTGIFNKFAWKPIFKGILRADVNEIVSPISAVVDETVKVATYTLAIPLGCIIFLVMLTTGTMIAGSSPTSPFHPGGSGSGNSIAACPDEVLQGNTCPLTSRNLSAGSYDKNISGHGSDSYWSFVGSFPVCEFRIPMQVTTQSLGFTQSWAPTAANAGSPESTCRNPQYNPNTYDFEQPFYGYALDISPTVPAEQFVYLPFLDYDGDGQAVENWTVSSSGSYGSTGDFTVFRGNDGNNEYLLVYLHLAAGIPANTQLESGACVGGMLVGGRYAEHLHIEMAVKPNSSSNWTVLKPEGYLCQ